MLFLQLLFAALVVAACLLLQTVLTLNEVNLAGHVAILAGVGSLLWYFFVGEPFTDSKKPLRLWVTARVNVRNLGGACALLAAVCVGLYVEVCRRQTVVFVPIDDVEVEVKCDGRSIGPTTKQTPLKERLRAGTHPFTFTAKGYDDGEDQLTTEAGWFTVPPERRLFIQLPARPEFALKNAFVDEHVKSNEAGQRPPQGPSQGDEPGEPARVFTTVGFQIVSESSGPLEVSDLHVAVVKATPLKARTFPYFGEALTGMPAAIDQGFAVLGREPGKVRVRDAPAAKTVRQGLPAAEYAITVHCEPGWTYKLAVEFRWRDLNKPGREGRKALDLAVLQAPRMWQDLAGKEPLRILSNARVDVLVRYLDSQAAQPAYTILVADPQAEAYFRDNRVKPNKRVAILPPAMLKELEAKRLLPQFPTRVARPCSFIAFDAASVLVQKPGSSGRGTLVENPHEAADLIAEYDRLAKLLLK